MVSGRMNEWRGFPANWTHAKTDDKRVGSRVERSESWRLPIRHGNAMGPFVWFLGINKRPAAAPGVACVQRPSAATKLSSSSRPRT